MKRARLVAPAVASALMAVGAGACGGDEAPVGTLPPIVTTSTTTTLLITTTTVQQFYVIQSGDTLSKIADSFGVNIDDLMAINGITNPDHIEAGQHLEIPQPRVVVDTLPATTSSVVTTTSTG